MVVSRRVRTVGLALLAALTCCVALAPATQAEVGTYAPNALKPVKPQPGDINSLSTQESGIFSCNVPYAVVQAKPSGFVTGSCTRGTHLHRDAKSGEYDTTYWDGGFVYGNYSGCGWIRIDQSDLAAAGGNDLCTWTSIGYNDNEIMIASNEGTQAPNSCSRNATTGRCTDGTSAVVRAGGCKLWANFRPWTSGQGATDPIRDIPASNGRVKWRYVSKYTTADGSGRYVMVRDDFSSQGQGNWGWMKESCLTSMPGRMAVN